MSQAPSSTSAALESGSPLDDARAFRRCLGQFATGIAIITTEHEGQPVGMAVNSFAAVSLDPALVLWSIRKESGSAAAFLAARKYAVNILEESQTEVSRIFGAGRPDKFDQVQWHYGAHGSPLIEPAIGHFECTLENVLDGGDHHILLGRVQRFVRFEGRPLLFTQGQYAVSQNHPSLLQPAALPQENSTGLASEMPLLSLLQTTNQHLSNLFDEHRQALDVTVATGRVLKCLGDGTTTLEALERTAYLGQTATEDALSTLIQQGDVIALGGEGGNASYALTANGHIKVEALRQRAMEFTQLRLQGLSEDEIQTAVKVLRTLQGL